jgi:hypothetical protein
LDELFQKILTSIKNESVPNVKIEFINTIEAINSDLSQESMKMGREKLEQLTIDEEFDVSYFSKKILHKIYNMKFPFFNEIK